MANRWGKMETMTQTLFSWAPKSLQRVTAAIQVRHLLLGTKAMANLDSTLKSRDMKKQSYDFSSSHVWMWKLDHTEGQAPKIWFELWCWRRLLRVPWIARRSNPTILKEISSEYSLEGKDWCWRWSSNTLATWCEELTHWKRPWCWERLKATGKGSGRRWDGYHWFNGNESEQTLGDTGE